MSETLRQAAHQALEALEKEPADYADWIRTMQAARAALRTALAEQPRRNVTYVCPCCHFSLERQE